MAVTADGILIEGAATGPVVGPPLAALWPGVVAAASARPPGEDDSVLIVAASEGAGEGPRVLDSLHVDGAVRALAGRVHAESTRLVAAVEDAADGPHLLVMDLARPEP
jgi:hypothetical protein